MMIPSVFFGKYSEARMKMNKTVSLLATGKSFALATASRETVFSRTNIAGSFVLRTLNDISATRLDFHFTLLKAALTTSSTPLEDSAIEILFGELIQTDWGCLVFADREDLWFEQGLFCDFSHRWKPYLAAVLKHASSFTLENKRFINARGNSSTFWQANSALMYILSRSGIPVEQIDAKLDEASYRSLCKQLGVS